MRYWVFKSDPEAYSFKDLKQEKSKTTYWNGVRNYQARNFLRDDIKKDDLVLFYHSNEKPNAVYGICKVVEEGYPDFTQFDPEDEHYFPAAKENDPVWFMVDVKMIEEFVNPVTINEMKKNPRLKDLILLKKGNRLSVMPINEQEFNEILLMAKK